MRFPAGSKIFFAKDEATAPHGMVDLVDAHSVAELAESETKRKFSFQIATNEENFVLATNSAEEQRLWIESVGRAIMMHAGMAALSEEVMAAISISSAANSKGGAASSGERKGGMKE